MGTLAGAARIVEGFPSLPADPGTEAAAAACPVMPALLPTIGEGAIFNTLKLVGAEERSECEVGGGAWIAGNTRSGTGAPKEDK